MISSLLSINEEHHTGMESNHTGMEATNSY